MIKLLNLIHSFITTKRCKSCYFYKNKYICVDCKLHSKYLSLDFFDCCKAGRIK